MAHRKSNITAAASLASVIMVACMATMVAAAGKEQPVNGEIVKFCSNTAFKDTCIKSLGKANGTKPKDLIKAAFESAVAEVQNAIKNTATYKKAESEKMTKGALDICERVLQTSIDDIRKSFDNINTFDINKVSYALDDVRVWLSSAITNKETCIDAFAKTRSKTGAEVREMLTTAGELMSNALAMVIEFQKLFKSFNLESIAEKIKNRQLLEAGDEIPSFISGAKRKLLAAPTLQLPPNVTVAQDGSGQFKTVQEAVNTAPVGVNFPFVILVKAGVYAEYVTIPKKTNHVVMIGEGPLKTRITGNRCYTGGFQTFDSATVKVDGESFTAKDIAFENTAGAVGHQAVALCTSGDLGLFYNVHMDGYQDTLYTHTNRQYFRECRISGTIDFIFGNSIAVFQKCVMVVRKPDPNQACMVTAQGRTEKNMTGVTVVQSCNITAEKDFLDAKPAFNAYLGRPWKDFSRTIIMESTIDGFINPAGWAPWSGDSYLNSLFYVEYENDGPGSNNPERPPGRVTWKGIHKFATPDEALAFTAAKQFVHDEWVLETGVPYDPGFMKKK